MSSVAAFQIVQSRTVEDCRTLSDIIITPEFGSVDWNGFRNADQLIRAGEKAARAKSSTHQSLHFPIPHSSGLLGKTFCSAA
jgi:hypothetical protein